jgi:hypothetical protein
MPSAHISAPGAWLSSSFAPHYCTAIPACIDDSLEPICLMGFEMCPCWTGKETTLGIYFKVVLRSMTKRDNVGDGKIRKIAIVYRI